MRILYRRKGKITIADKIVEKHVHTYLVREYVCNG